jgi:hypothetical protein
VAACVSGCGVGTECLEALSTLPTVLRYTYEHLLVLISYLIAQCTVMGHIKLHCVGLSCHSAGDKDPGLLSLYATSTVAYTLKSLRSQILHLQCQTVYFLGPLDPKFGGTTFITKNGKCVSVYMAYYPTKLESLWNKSTMAGLTWRD